MYLLEKNLLMLKGDLKQQKQEIIWLERTIERIEDGLHRKDLAE